jgi:hypothetical protein
MGGLPQLMLWIDIIDPTFHFDADPDPDPDPDPTPSFTHVANQNFF